LNEYLDGEIGLADKAELERIMSQDPEVSSSFKELRRIGMLMSSMPQVSVHPYAFRARVNDALDSRQRSFLTPQRAFAGSMLVTMLVIGLTFGLNIYQSAIFGTAPGAVQPIAGFEAGPGPSNSGLVIDVAASPERYFERMLIEVQLGYVDQSLMGTISGQSTVYEGATCLDEDLSHSVQFSRPLSRQLSLVVSPEEALALGRLSEELTGMAPVVESSGNKVPLADYLQQFAGKKHLSLDLRFQ
jgi:hypothetical protein